MSVSYMAVAIQPEGVGVAVFKQQCDVIGKMKPGTIALGLSKGELRWAGYVPNPCVRRVDVCAGVATALAVREWFHVGPCVCGAWEPEEFVVSSAAVGVGGYGAFFGALAMLWPMEKTLADHLDWFHVVQGPVSEGYGGPRTKKSVLARLVAEEQAVVNADPMSAVVESVALGLLHLGRLPRIHARRADFMCTERVGKR